MFILLQLTFWDELDSEGRERLYSELNDLDLDDVTESFKRCLETAEEQKLDHRMTKLPAHICGSILTATNKVSQLFEAFYCSIKLNTVITKN